MELLCMAAGGLLLALAACLVGEMIAVRREEKSGDAPLPDAVHRWACDMAAELNRKGLLIPGAKTQAEHMLYRYIIEHAGFVTGEPE